VTEDFLFSIHTKDSLGEKVASLFHLAVHVVKNHDMAGPLQMICIPFIEFASNEHFACFSTGETDFKAVILGLLVDD
jgi:hypothetical protein